MTNFTFQATDQLDWQPHPSIPEGRMAAFVPGQEGVTPKVAMVELPAGLCAEPHLHRDADDVLYVLRGSGTMWIEGEGEIFLHEGCFLRIPAGVRHGPREIREALTIYNLWLPVCATASARKEETR